MLVQETHGGEHAHSTAWSLLFLMTTAAIYIPFSSSYYVLTYTEFPAANRATFFFF